ncbi:hypothetical protein ACWOBV_02170 [Globicatella sanguinis]
MKKGFYHSTVWGQTKRKLLKGLLIKEVLCWHGNSKQDPKQYYTISNHKNVD